MATTISHWQVNAFSAQLDGGNPAAVVVLKEWLADDALARIAAKITLPATAFVVRGEGGGPDWEICWFSPSGEIMLCGHATLASAHVLLGQDGGERLALGTRSSGILEARRLGHHWGEGYEIALPAIASEPKANAEAAALIGAKPSEVHRSELGYTVLLYRDEAELRALRPDLAGLGKLGTDQFIATAPGSGTDIASRVFTHGGEDSVTGSAHAVLAPYWAGKLARNRLTAHQASERGGDLTLRLEGDRVWLGGRCVTVGKHGLSLET